MGARGAWAGSRVRGIRPELGRPLDGNPIVRERDNGIRDPYEKRASNRASVLHEDALVHHCGIWGMANRSPRAGLLPGGTHLGILPDDLVGSQGLLDFSTN